MLKKRLETLKQMQMAAENATINPSVSSAMLLLSALEKAKSNYKK